ncbi:MAG: primosomal protein N' [Aestuariivirga sp.]|uniref:primosomal protein N' n=1 Tax=Aestuariivirga sp. TaxID=2650926 RepID=UPI0025BA4B99|nr:primosomal protein N' [Aestuariivirga sp.]MCA3560051.1 primosomal protein N' [Aestuariivirga sp.]
MTRDSAIAGVLLPLALDGPYSYRVPPGMALEPGSYVIVPLGPRQMIGVVWAVKDKADTDKTLRDVAQVFDMPPLPETHRRFVDWLSAYYLEPAGNVLRMVLRSPGAFEGPREQIAYRATGHVPKRMTPQRARVLETAREGFAMRAAELAEAAGVGTSVIKVLAKDGALEAVALPAHRRFAEPDLNAGGFALSKGQQAAADALRAVVAQRQHKVMLLDGVTGSGKTEVYFEAMAAALASGGQALLLLPEIALTQPFIERVERRFGAEPAQWHSDLRPRERERVWRGVADGTAKIVVGARSALFLPWKKLKLIVVDEEHESAYKQDDGVPYHARDMAVLYGSIGKFPVVLSSATPSLETLVNVDRGRYGVVRLMDRHGRPELPEIGLIDMKRAALEPGTWISPPLFDEVKTTLEQGDQALLFLNRRGYAPLTLCRACGHRLECPNCAASLVEHRFRRQLMCHHCGHLEPMPKACPGCHTEGKMVPVGPGVERLAEEAAVRFPQARIAILSSDLSRGPLLRDTICGVEEGQFNLVIGTQLVAKGHHFPHLTLVGVVDADLALESSDPRGAERTWALMAQVAGRAGRGAKPGRALVQTYLPEHPLMQALRKGDRDSYLNQEKAIRETAGLPPYGRLAAIIISGNDAAETERFARALGLIAPLADGIAVLGPAAAPIAMVRGRRRFRFLVKAKRDMNVQAFLRLWLKDVKPKGSLALQVDVDPYNFL